MSMIGPVQSRCHEGSLVRGMALGRLFTFTVHVVNSSVFRMCLNTRQIYSCVTPSCVLTQKGFTE